jgi:hypothetical protein
VRVSSDDDFDDAELTLTPAEIESIKGSIAAGVTYSIDWQSGDYTITAIRWQKDILGGPAVPNEIVESIQRHVTSEGMPLFLDGVEYFVKKISTDG